MIRTGPELRAWREARNMTRLTLGSLLGRYPSTIINWEKMPELPRMVALAIQGLEQQETGGAS